MTRNLDLWLEIMDMPLFNDEECEFSQNAHRWLSDLMDGEKLRQVDILALMGLLQNSERFHTKNIDT